MLMPTKILIVLSSTILIVFGGLGGWAEIKEYKTIHPSPDKTSRFLTNYSPDKVGQAFSYPGNRYGSSTLGQAAGEEFVKLTYSYEPQFPLRDTDRAPFLTGVYDDIEAQLLSSGARVFAKGGEPTTGLKLEYSVDHSVGSVLILPVATVSSEKGLIMTHTGKPMQFPPGIRWVKANIQVSERWYPHPGYVSVPSAMVLPAQ
jgi:hypothetical protein